MDEDEMVVSESEDSNDSWTTEEFSSEFIMRYGSRWDYWLTAIHFLKKNYSVIMYIFHVMKAFRIRQQWHAWQ